MEASSIAIHTESVDQPYRRLGEVEAKRRKASLYSSSPTLEAVNGELRQKAAQMGANAVLHVTYSRGMSLISYEVLTARGIAVIVASDEKPCPYCAEKVKAQAIVCKHCKSDLTQKS
jgi:hypothetical protein